jgi:hypothetical protein
MEQSQDPRISFAVGFSNLLYSATEEACSADDHFFFIFFFSRVLLLSEHSQNKVGKDEMKTRRATENFAHVTLGA